MKAGLGDVQPLGGAAEMKLFGDGGEISQMPEFNGTIHIQMISFGINKILDI